MTLFIALVAFVLSLFGLILILTIPPKVPDTPEEKWNDAARNLRREFDSWKVNRREEDKRFTANVERELEIIKDHLAQHIKITHLDDGGE